MKNKVNKKGKAKTGSRAQRRAQARKTSQSRPNPLTQMTNWVAGLVVILPLLYSTRTMDPPIAIRHLFLSFFALAFAFVFAWLNKKEYSLRRDLLSKVFLGLLGAFLLWNAVSLFGAINPQEGLQLIFRYGLFFGLIPLFMLTAIAEEARLGVIWKSAAVICLITALMGILQYYGLIFQDQLTGQDLPYALRSNRNLFASAQVLLIPFSLIVALRQKGIWSWLAGIAILLSVFVIILAQTRGAWLSLAGILGILTLGIVLAKDSLGKEVGRKALRLGLIGIPLLGLLLTLAIMADDSGKLKSSLAERSIGSLKSPENQTESIAASSVNERLFLWNNSLKMAADHPVTGVGAGNWRLNIASYGLGDIQASNGSRVSLRPHNMLLQVLDETGIPGLLMLLGIWIVLAIVSIKSFFAAKTPDRKLFILLMASVLAAFFIDTLVSFGNERIENMLYLSLAAGVIMGLYEKQEQSDAETTSFSFSKPMAIGLMLMFVGSGIFAYARYNYEAQFNLARAYFEIGNGPRALEEARKGKSSLITLAPNATPIEMYSAQGYSLQKKYDRALSELELGLSYNPSNTSMLNNIGTCYTNMNQFEKAIVYYKKVLEIAPNTGNTQKNLAINLFNLQRFQECLDVIATFNIAEDKYFQDLKRSAEEQVK